MDHKRQPRHEYGKDALGNFISPDDVGARLERAGRLLALEQPQNPLWRIMVKGGEKIKALEAKTKALTEENTTLSNSVAQLEQELAEAIACTF